MSTIQDNYPIILKFLEIYLTQLGYQLEFCCVFGSHVYNTAKETSDIDLYLIVQSKNKNNNKTNNEVIEIDVHHSMNYESIMASKEATTLFKELEHLLGGLEIDLSIRSFSSLKKDVEKGAPYAIEVIFIPEQFVLYINDPIKSYRHSFDFSILQDPFYHNALSGISNFKSVLSKLKKEDNYLEHLNKFRTVMNLIESFRSGFSEKARWAEDAAVKRLQAAINKFKTTTDEKDRDDIISEIKRALKSKFHEIRIYHYGIQIGIYGKIIDWEVANHYLEELMLLDINQLDIKTLKEFHKNELKELGRQFRKTMPKRQKWQEEMLNFIDQEILEMHDK